MTRTPFPVALAVLPAVLLLLLSACGGGGGGGGGKEVFGVVYVSADDPAASDSNPGSPSLPFASIQAAVDEASSKYVTAEVHVAWSVGSYAPVTMVEGVSLYGGYSQDWASRNKDTYETWIAGTGGPDGAAVIAGPGVTRATVLDGFRVYGGSVGTVYGLVVDGGSPTVTGNDLYGGGSGALMATAVFCDNGASPLLSGNDIRGGSGNVSTGVHNKLSSPVLRHNGIDGGHEGVSRGVFNEIQSDPEITSCSVVGGKGTDTTAVINASGSDPVISDSSIYGSLGTATTAIGIWNDASSPQISESTVYGHGGSVLLAADAIGILSTNGSGPWIIESSVIGGSGTQNNSGQSTAVRFSGCPSGALVADSSLEGGNGYNSYGARIISSSPQIVDSHIAAGGAGSAVWAVLVTGASSPKIERNTIVARTSSVTIGLSLEGAMVDATVRNNVIDGGPGSYSFGVQVYNGAQVKLWNNTIDGGSCASEGAALRLGSANATVQNNILFTSGGSGYVVEEIDESSDPVIFTNNDLFDAFVLYYNEGSSSLNSVGIKAISGYTGLAFVDPQFLDKAGGDFHLTGSTPTAVSQGGANLASTWLPAQAVDIAWVNRTAPWSMGAYEKD